MLSIQLSDKRKACFVDDHLRNRWKSARPQKEKYGRNILSTNT